MTPVKPAWRYELAKLRTWINKRLKWLPHIALVAGTVVAFVFAPTVDEQHPPDRLQPWFIAAGTTLVGIGLVLLFYSARGNNRRALEYLGGATVAYALGGICIAGAGLIPWEEDGVYRYLLSASVGTFAAFITTTALVTYTHLRGERDAALGDLREKYVKDDHGTDCQKPRP